MARRRGRRGIRRAVRERDAQRAEEALRNLAHAQRVELEAEGYVLVARRAKYEAVARAFAAGATGAEVATVAGVTSSTASKWRRIVAS